MKTKSLTKEKLSGVSGGNRNGEENSWVMCNVICGSCRRSCTPEPLTATEALRLKHKMEDEGCIFCHKKGGFYIDPVSR